MQTEINQIAICIINYKSFEYTKFCIDNIKMNTNLNFNLYVYDIDEESSLEMIEYIQELNNSSCKDYLDKYPHKYFKVDTMPLNEIKSMFMVESKEEYLCIMPNDCYVGKNWLEELIYNYTQCQNTGIISIKNQATKCSLSVLPYDSDKLEIDLSNVWLGENNFVEGLMFFNRQMANNLYPLMFGVGEKIFAYSDDEMSFVSNLMGKNNFYIPKQSLKKIKIQNKILYQEKSKENDLLFRKYANNLAKSNK